MRIRGRGMWRSFGGGRGTRSFLMSDRLGARGGVGGWGAVIGEGKGRGKREVWNWDGDLCLSGHLQLERSRQFR